MNLHEIMVIFCCCYNIQARKTYIFLKVFGNIDNLSIMNLIFFKLFENRGKNLRIFIIDKYKYIDKQSPQNKYCPRLHLVLTLIKISRIDKTWCEKGKKNYIWQKIISVSIRNNSYIKTYIPFPSLLSFC
jgi:hypothetical protein